MMKNIAKILLGVSTFLTTNLQLHAQISVGGRFGITGSNVIAPTLNNSLKFNNVYDYNVGIVTEVSLGKWFAVQPELNYVSKGFSSKLGAEVTLFNIKLPIGVTARTNIQYLEIPLLLKAKFGNENVHAYLTAGPTLGYALKGRLTGSTSLLVDVKVYDTDINLNANNFNRFEVGGAVGGGLGIGTGHGQLFIDGRYTRGLREAYEIPFIGTRVTNQGFGVSIGYLHRLN
jgi:hypothetical protein